MTRTAPERLAKVAEPAMTQDLYEERIRFERYRGRMFVLALADDAWARYGWVRPKVARR